jgi:CHAT domain-containing protein
VIPLPGLTAAQATYRANQFLEALRGLAGPAQPAAELSATPGDPGPFGVIDEVLAWLADAVTGPVLARLGLDGPAAGPLPRLWWCPTGPVSVLPLHAAGRDGAGRRVLDRVVSSYASTLRALRDARDRPVQAGDPRMLLVTMPVTPYLEGEGALAGVRAEAIAVARRFQAATTHLTGELATVARVGDALGRTRYAHFACHGSVDPGDPSAGGLYLHDGPLTIRLLARSDLRGAELAVLSACQSATGSLRHLDEAITVAAATQLAGFRHVIATLWNVADRAAPELTADVYDTLAGATVSVAATDGSARALHGAVHELRAAGHPPAVWAPFVHLGP